MTTAVVVDDSRVMRKILIRILTAIGYEVLEASDGDDAVDVIEAAVDAGTIPAVALCDWNMPGMDGLELIRYLRVNPRLDSMRILMVTSETEFSRIDEALRSGADEYLMKPFDQEALEEKLALLGLGPVGAL